MTEENKIRELAWVVITNHSKQLSPKFINQKTKVLSADSAQNYPYNNCLSMQVDILWIQEENMFLIRFIQERIIPELFK